MKLCFDGYQFYLLFISVSVVRYPSIDIHMCMCQAVSIHKQSSWNDGEHLIEKRRKIVDQLKNVLLHFAVSRKETVKFS